MNDAMARLKAADPTAATDLDRIDAETWAVMRDEIAATPTSLATALTSSPRRVWRPKGMGRRGAVVAGVAALLAGGGVAYAVNESSDGFDPGVGCLSAWPSGEVGPSFHDDMGGPWLTGDAIADCATYAARAGQPPIDDPVAFQLGDMTYVAPAPDVPKGAMALTGTVRSPAVVELQLSLEDLVDGGSAWCRSLDEARDWAQSEVDRLGLHDWHVVTRGTASDRTPCARFFPRGPGILEITPSSDPVEGTFTAGHWQLADDLRASITDACLSLADARAIADQEIARYYADPWPTTSVLDESAPCARVDAAIGGNTQVTVYGPTNATG